MGVPAFFRWLSKKYPSIVVHCVEEKVGETVNSSAMNSRCSLGLMAGVRCILKVIESESNAYTKYPPIY